MISFAICIRDGSDVKIRMRFVCEFQRVKLRGCEYICECQCKKIHGCECQLVDIRG